MEPWPRPTFHVALAADLHVALHAPRTRRTPWLFKGSFEAVSWLSDGSWPGPSARRARIGAARHARGLRHAGALAHPEAAGTPWRSWIGRHLQARLRGCEQRPHERPGVEPLGRGEAAPRPERVIELPGLLDQPRSMRIVPRRCAPGEGVSTMRTIATQLPLGVCSRLHDEREGRERARRRGARSALRAARRDAGRDFSGKRGRRRVRHGRRVPSIGGQPCVRKPSFAAVGRCAVDIR